ncbi:MAG TPA: Asp-tRNA(Asn)/Glu-tRNA(Gln) amidotransferase subunit GatA [Dehalococcoidia bacterium]|nr:Asp-tRNA(Asn)/Glu-tRNA(Gln) amidotransferase subunit GatA [Dehalococcoidia bacterium]
MPELYDLSITGARDLLAKREVSSRELTRAVLDRVAAVDGRVRAYVTITEDLALQQADAADARIAAGDAAPLTGIPVCIKDVLCTRGVRTTCSSRMLENFVPPYDAHVVERLQAQGSVMIGKSNMDEFAMGSSNENSAFFPTHNPWDLNRVPGGSSGGSASAVAAGECIYALGTDTGGSIRQPAALTGVVGVKPTYGRVSRYGLVAFASSLDQIGPLTRSVEDAALVLNAIAGHDARDSTSAPLDVPDFTANLGGDLAGVRLGVPKEYVTDDLDPGVRDAFMASIDVLKGLGATVDFDLSLPSTPAALAAYYVIAPSEASANLARYDGVKYGYSRQDGASMWENMETTRGTGFGDEVKRRIMLGTYALSAGYYDAYYLKAQQVRTLIRREFDAAFERYDAIVAPVTPTPAFKIGEKVDDPISMYLSDVFTLPSNLAGLPCASVPSGFVSVDERPLPIGLQIIARPFDESTVLRVGHAYEQATDWNEYRPPLD